MKTVRRFWARKPLRNRLSGVRQGEYSEPIEFIELDGVAVEVGWIKSVETLCPRTEELKDVQDENPAPGRDPYDAAVYPSCGR